MGRALWGLLTVLTLSLGSESTAALPAECPYVRAFASADEDARQLAFTAFVGCRSSTERSLMVCLVDDVTDREIGCVGIGPYPGRWYAVRGECSREESRGPGTYPYRVEATVTDVDGAVHGRFRSGTVILRVYC